MVKRSVACIVPLVVFMLVCVPAALLHAQEQSTEQTREHADQRARILPLGSPATADSLIETDRQTRQEQLRGLAALKPYYSWKDSFTERYKLSFAFDYIPLAVIASDAMEGADDCPVRSDLSTPLSSWSYPECQIQYQVNFVT